VKVRLAKEIIIKKINECFVRLIVLDLTLEGNLVKLFRVKDPNCAFKPHFKKNKGSWDGYDYFYKKQVLPVGLLYKLEKYCADNKISLKHDNCTTVNDVSIEDISEYLEVLKKKNELQRVPHDYQLASVYDSIINKRNIVVIGTSGGKSFTIYSIVRYCLKEKCKVLVIVPQKTLVDQLYSNFLEYGWDTVGIHTQKRHSEIAEKRIIKDVVITTWQSVYKKVDALRQFDAVIVDEVQCAKGKEVAGLLNKCENAVIRVGFTGTMYEEDSYDYMHVISSFGKPKVYADYAKLIEDDRITSFEVVTLVLEYPLNVKQHILDLTGKNYFEENEAVIMNEGRNNFIFHLMSKLKRNTLILFFRKDHGKLLFETVTKKFPNRKVFYVDGSTPNEERARVIAYAELHDNVDIIASIGVFSTGINITNLDNLIFAHSTKSLIKVLQSIGRILRKHINKSKAYVFDIVDDLRFEDKYKIKHVNYGYLHGKARKKIYISNKFKLTIKKIDLSAYFNLEES